MSNVLNIKGPPIDVTKSRTPEYSTTGIGDSTAGIAPPFRQDAGIYGGAPYDAGIYGGGMYKFDYFGTHPEYPTATDDEASEGPDCTAYLYGEYPERSPFDRDAGKTVRTKPLFDRAAQLANGISQAAEKVYHDYAPKILPAIQAIGALAPHAAGVSVAIMMMAGAALFIPGTIDAVETPLPPTDEDIILKAEKLLSKTREKIRELDPEAQKAYTKRFYALLGKLLPKESKIEILFDRPPLEQADFFLPLPNKFLLPEKNGRNKTTTHIKIKLGQDREPLIPMVNKVGAPFRVRNLRRLKPASTKLVYQTLKFLYINIKETELIKDLPLAIELGIELSKEGDVSALAGIFSELLPLVHRPDLTITAEVKGGQDSGGQDSGGKAGVKKYRKVMLRYAEVDGDLRLYIASHPGDALTLLEEWHRYDPLSRKRNWPEWIDKINVIKIILPRPASREMDEKSKWTAAIANELKTNLPTGFKVTHSERDGKPIISAERKGNAGSPMHPQMGPARSGGKPTQRAKSVYERIFENDAVKLINELIKKLPEDTLSWQEKVQIRNDFKKRIKKTEVSSRSTLVNELRRLLKTFFAYIRESKKFNDVELEKLALYTILKAYGISSIKTLKDQYLPAFDDISWIYSWGFLQRAISMLPTWDIKDISYEWGIRKKAAIDSRSYINSLGRNIPIDLINIFYTKKAEDLASGDRQKKKSYKVLFEDSEAQYKESMGRTIWKDVRALIDDLERLGVSNRHLLAERVFRVLRGGNDSLIKAVESSFQAGRFDLGLWDVTQKLLWAYFSAKDRLPKILAKQDKMVSGPIDNSKLELLFNIFESLYFTPVEGSDPLDRGKPSIKKIDILSDGSTFVSGLDRDNRPVEFRLFSDSDQNRIFEIEIVGGQDRLPVLLPGLSKFAEEGTIAIKAPVSTGNVKIRVKWDEGIGWKEINSEARRKGQISIESDRLRKKLMGGADPKQIASSMHSLLRDTADYSSAESLRGLFKLEAPEQAMSAVDVILVWMKNLYQMQGLLGIQSYRGGNVLIHLNCRRIGRVEVEISPAGSILFAHKDEVKTASLIEAQARKSIKEMNKEELDGHFETWVKNEAADKFSPFPREKKLTLEASIVKAPGPRGRIVIQAVREPDEEIIVKKATGKSKYKSDGADNAGTLGGVDIKMALVKFLKNGTAIELGNGYRMEKMRINGYERYFIHLTDISQARLLWETLAEYDLPGKALTVTAPDSKEITFEKRGKYYILHLENIEYAGVLWDNISGFGLENEQIVVVLHDVDTQTVQQANAAYQKSNLHKARAGHTERLTDFYLINELNLGDDLAGKAPLIFIPNNPRTHFKTPSPLRGEGGGEGATPSPLRGEGGGEGATPSTDRTATTTRAEVSVVGQVESGDPKLGIAPQWFRPNERPADYNPGGSPEAREVIDAVFGCFTLDPTKRFLKNYLDNKFRAGSPEAIVALAKDYFYKSPTWARELAADIGAELIRASHLSGIKTDYVEKRSYFPALVNYLEWLSGLKPADQDPILNTLSTLLAKVDPGEFYAAIRHVNDRTPSPLRGEEVTPSPLRGEGVTPSPLRGEGGACPERARRASRRGEGESKKIGFRVDLGIPSETSEEFPLPLPSRLTLEMNGPRSEVVFSGTTDGIEGSALSLTRLVNKLSEQDATKDARIRVVLMPTFDLANFNAGFKTVTQIFSDLMFPTHHPGGLTMAIFDRWNGVYVPFSYTPEKDEPHRIVPIANIHLGELSQLARLMDAWYAIPEGFQTYEEWLASQFPTRRIYDKFDPAYYKEKIAERYNKEMANLGMNKKTWPWWVTDGRTPSLTITIPQEGASEETVSKAIKEWVDNLPDFLHFGKKAHYEITAKKAEEKTLSGEARPIWQIDFKREVYKESETVGANPGKRNRFPDAGAFFSFDPTGRSGGKQKDEVSLKDILDIVGSVEAKDLSDVQKSKLNQWITAHSSKILSEMPKDSGPDKWLDRITKFTGLLRDTLLHEKPPLDLLLNERARLVGFIHNSETTDLFEFIEEIAGHLIEARWVRGRKFDKDKVKDTEIQSIIKTIIKRHIGPTPPVPTSAQELNELHGAWVEFIKTKIEDPEGPQYHETYKLLLQALDREFHPNTKIRLLKLANHVELFPKVSLAILKIELKALLGKAHSVLPVAKTLLHRTPSATKTLPKIGKSQPDRSGLFIDPEGRYGVRKKPAAPETNDKTSVKRTRDPRSGAVIYYKHPGTFFSTDSLGTGGGQEKKSADQVFKELVAEKEKLQVEMSELFKEVAVNKWPSEEDYRSLEGVETLKQILSKMRNQLAAMNALREKLLRLGTSRSVVEKFEYWEIREWIHAMANIMTRQKSPIEFMIEDIESGVAKHPSIIKVFNIIKNIRHKGADDFKLLRTIGNDFKVVISISETAKLFGRLPDWLKSIIINFITNAQKNRQPIDVAALDIDYDPDTRTFSFANNGLSIPKEIAEKIFKEPVHGDPDKPGAGESLFIAYQKINLLGGKIWFDRGSEADPEKRTPAKGPTFYIQLPLEESDKHAKLPKPSMDKLLSIKKNGLCCSSALVDLDVDRIPSGDGYGSSESQKGAIVTFPNLKTEFEKDSMGERISRNNRYRYYLSSDARLKEALKTHEQYISCCRERGKIPTVVNGDADELLAATKADKERKWDRCHLKTTSQKHTFSFEKFYGSFQQEGMGDRVPTKEEFKDELLDIALYKGYNSILPAMMERAEDQHELITKPQEILEEKAANSIVFLVDMDKLEKVRRIEDSMEIGTADEIILPENIEYILVPDNLWETVAGVFHEDSWKGKLVRVGYTTANILIEYFVVGKTIEWSTGSLVNDDPDERFRFLSDAKIPDYKRAIKEIAKKNPDKMYFAHGSRLLTPGETSNVKTTPDPSGKSGNSENRTVERSWTSGSESGSVADPVEGAYLVNTVRSEEEAYGDMLQRYLKDPHYEYAVGILPYNSGFGVYKGGKSSVHAFGNKIPHHTHPYGSFIHQSWLSYKDFTTIQVGEAKTITTQTDYGLWRNTIIKYSDNVARWLSVLVAGDAGIASPVQPGIAVFIKKEDASGLNVYITLYIPWHHLLMDSTSYSPCTIEFKKGDKNIVTTQHIIPVNLKEVSKNNGDLDRIEGLFTPIKGGRELSFTIPAKAITNIGAIAPVSNKVSDKP